MTQHDGHDPRKWFNTTFALLHPDYKLHGKLLHACMHALHKTLGTAMTDDPVSIYFWLTNPAHWLCHVEQTQ